MNLMDAKDQPFFYEDTLLDRNLKYRVFCYTIPGYEQYQLPDAKESRGSMFLLDSRNDKMLEMIAHPMPKFFTYGEQPETAKLDLSKAIRFTLKPDGSLLSSYLDVITGELSFKTKRKPSQESFNNILDEVLYSSLKKEMEVLTRYGYTIDIELTSPKNRVILAYEKASISVLKARSRLTGEFLDIFSDHFKSEYPEISKHIVKEMDRELFKDLNSKQNKLHIKGIEGAVAEMPDGTLAKIKTMYYLTQNRFAKIQNFKKYDQLLVEACIEETFDELRTLFHYQNRSENYNIEGIMAAMDSVEKQVAETYNPLHNLIFGFYNKNKELSFSDYSEKAKAENLQKYMGLLMPLHRGDKINFNAFYMKTIGNRIKVKKD